MKIAYICNEYPPRPHGGIGIFYQRCARAMSHAGHEVTVVGVGNETMSYDDQGVRVRMLKRFPIRPLAQFVNRWKVYDWLRRHIATYEIDIIEVPDFQGYLPYFIPGCPVVVRLHLTETIIVACAGRRARPLFRLFERHTLQRHGNWIACSRSVLQRTIDTLGIEPNRATVIYAATPNAAPGHLPDGIPAQYILFAGTVSHRKGAFDVAEAFVRLRDRYPDLHVVYAGPIDKTGPSRTEDEIIRIIGRDSADRVTFTGRLPHGAILALMAHARAFVFPSVLEAFPLVVIEAMSMRCPVITYDTQPFSEFICDNENGLLVSPRSRTRLAYAIDRVLGDPELSTRLTANALVTVDTMCSEEKFVQANLKFYNTICDSRPRNPSQHHSETTVPTNG